MSGSCSTSPVVLYTWTRDSGNTSNCRPPVTTIVFSSGIPHAEEEKYEGSWNAMVVVFVMLDKSSEVCHPQGSLPPIKMTPSGESQDTWFKRPKDRWWDVSHWPVKVEHVYVVSASWPPHRVNPEAEWARRPGEGRPGVMVQAVPSSRIISADNSVPVPPVTRIAGKNGMRADYHFYVIRLSLLLTWLQRSILITVAIICSSYNKLNPILNFSNPGVDTMTWTLCSKTNNSNLSIPL